MPQDEQTEATAAEEQKGRATRSARRTVSLASISSRVAKLESSQKLYLIRAENNSSQAPNSSSSSNDSKVQKNDAEPILVSHIIGNFGLFQLLVLIFSGLRDFTDSYDALMMSMVFRPENDFYCLDLDDNNNKLANQTLTRPRLDEGKAIGEAGRQCFKSNQANNSKEPEVCESWQFIRGLDQEASLVVEWALVCQRHWLVAPIQSCFFLGLVVGNLTWGYLADKYGRRRVYLLGHALQVLFGVASIFTTNVGLYAACRFFTAFGSASHNVLYSVQIEMIATKYRPYCTALNHFGWGAGIMSTPFIARISADYRYVIGVSPITTLIMLPFAFLLPESWRWLVMRGRVREAEHELLRVARFNKIPITSKLEDNVRHLLEASEKTATNLDAMRRSNKEVTARHEQPSAYSVILRDRVLLRDTLILCYSIFLGYLFYYVLTLNFAYIENLSVEANFVTSGAGEWLSVVLGALLLGCLSRRASLCLVFNLMAMSFLFQYLIDSGAFPQLDTQLIITLNNALGTASTLLLVFVLLIVNQEIYPTLVRQTGSSFVNTVAELGATAAPIVIQVSRVCGLWRSDLVSAFACFVGSLLVLFMTETGDKELS